MIDEKEKNFEENLGGIASLSRSMASKDQVREIKVMS